MEPPPIQYVRTGDGYNLAYCEAGKGPPAVVVPSRLNSMHWTWNRWGPWFRPLTEGHRVITFDARGQGLSTRGLRPDISLDDFVGDLGLIIDHLALPKVVLIAHGFGGHVAVRYAVKHPERVAALVLVTVTVELRAWNMPLWMGVAGENWDLFLRSLAPRSVSEEDIDRWVASMKEIETHADYMRAQSVAAPSQIDDALPLLRAPTLVLHPRNYVMVPEEEAPKLAGAIPNARMVMLSCTHHDFLGDAPEFVAAIRAFIRELPDRQDSVRRAPSPRLSGRESEVLRLIAAGKSNQQIADALVLSLRTVERHITNLYAKIDAHSKADATAYALRHGFE